MQCLVILVEVWWTQERTVWFGCLQTNLLKLYKVKNYTKNLYKTTETAQCCFCLIGNFEAPGKLLACFEPRMSQLYVNRFVVPIIRGIHVNVHAMLCFL